MYKIIGGDGKEYGPITAEQLRQWIAEGRANFQTQVLPDGATEWTMVAALPEFADASAPAAIGAIPAGGAAVLATPETILGRDYALDIGDCISRGWALVKANFWPIVGVSLMIYFINGAINQVLGLPIRGALPNMMQNHQVEPGAILLIACVTIIGMPISTIFMGGLFKYYLMLIRGEPATVGDAFSGFSYFAQLALLGLVSGILTLIGYAFCIIPGLYLNVAWVFAMPLIVDRKMGFWDAMELSRKMVSKHWFIVFALLLVNGLLAMAGLIACCIGIFVTAPIAVAALLYAYEDIFGRPAA
jgi:hypothetical protein